MRIFTPENLFPVISVMFLLVTGSEAAKIVEAGHNRVTMFNKCKEFNLTRTDSERLFRQLVVDGVLEEELVITAQDHAVCYLKVGKRADPLLQGRLAIKFHKQGTRKRLDVETERKDQMNPQAQIRQECYHALVQLAKDISQSQCHPLLFFFLSQVCFILILK